MRPIQMLFAIALFVSPTQIAGAYSFPEDHDSYAIAPKGSALYWRGYQSAFDGADSALSRTDLKPGFKERNAARKFFKYLEDVGAGPDGRRYSNAETRCAAITNAMGFAALATILSINDPERPTRQFPTLPGYKDTNFLGVSLSNNSGESAITLAWVLQAEDGCPKRQDLFVPYMCDYAKSYAARRAAQITEFVFLVEDQAPEIQPRLVSSLSPSSKELFETCLPLIQQEQERNAYDVLIALEAGEMSLAEEWAEQLGGTSWLLMRHFTQR